MTGKVHYGKRGRSFKNTYYYYSTLAPRVAVERAYLKRAQLAKDAAVVSEVSEDLHFSVFFILIRSSSIYR